MKPTEAMNRLRDANEQIHFYKQILKIINDCLIEDELRIAKTLVALALEEE
jgi:hypothetical protein